MTKSLAPPGRIRWHLYADGQPHTLRQGTDFHTTTERAAMAARTWASNNGRSLRSQTRGDTLTVTFMIRSAEPAPAEPGTYCHHAWSWAGHRTYRGITADHWHCPKCNATLREPREIP